MSAARKVNGVTVERGLWDAILASVRYLSDRKVRVGVLRDETKEGGSASLVAVVATHEFGAPDLGIRERSFIRSTFQVHRINEIRDTTRRVATAVLQGRLGTEQALGLIGAFGAEAVKEAISKRLIVQELSPMTIAAKAAKNPPGRNGADPSTALVDSGQLRASITWSLDDEGGS